MAFRGSWHNAVTTRIPRDIDPEQIITLLHDHDFLITMSPIVTRHEIRDRDSLTGKVTYDVWEKIDLLPFGLWKHEISFVTAFMNKQDGVVTDIQAALGFTSEANYSVKPGTQWDGEGAGYVLDEQIESSCNILLKPFIAGQMVPVRQKMHDKILDAARSRQDNVRKSRESGGQAPDGNFI